MLKELFLGVGNSRDKKLYFDGKDRTLQNPVTCDFDPNCNPDVLWDLNETPWPFEDSSFDEIHAYEVLEHLGTQGDWRSFFDHFAEIYRILVPGGHLFMSVPRWDGMWAWSDPGHTRIISEGTLAFLDQSKYAWVGKTNMTDYRHYWKGDLRAVWAAQDEHVLWMMLKKYDGNA